MARGNPNFKKKAIEGDKAEEITVGVVSGKSVEEIAKAIDKGTDDDKEEAREENLIATSFGANKMYKIIIPKQSNSDSNRPVFIPNHDGGRDWVLERNKEYVVPLYVVNILKESIAVSTEVDLETDSRRAITRAEKIPRFSLQISEEIRL